MYCSKTETLISVIMAARLSEETYHNTFTIVLSCYLQQTLENVFQPQGVISLINSSYVDGTIYCKLERDARSTVEGKEFDLVNNKFHLLVAIGNSVGGKSHCLLHRMSCQL